MKLHILSDIHRNTSAGAFTIPGVGADILVIAGDFGGTLSSAMGWLGEQQIGIPIIVVAGNHDYWHSAGLDLEIEWARSMAPANVHILDGDFVIIDGVRFVGATLWTDYLAMGEGWKARATLEAVESSRDFGRIVTAGSTRRISVNDLIDAHQRQLHAIEQHLRTPFDGVTVVVTHHAPSTRSLAGGTAMMPIDGHFASRLDPLIQETQPTVWIHGHIHAHQNYQIGLTHVIANPRGYVTKSGVENTGFDPAFVINVRSKTDVYEEQAAAEIAEISTMREAERQAMILVIKRELLSVRMYRQTAINRLGLAAYEELIAGLTDAELAIVMAADR